VLPTLAASGYVALAPDVRGCGESDKPAGGYDAASRAADVRELVHSLGLGDAPVFVAGQGDDGAAVAEAYAAQFPAEVAGAARLSAAPPSPVSPAPDWHDGFHRTPDLPELLIAPQLFGYLRHFFRAWAHDPNAISEADLAIYADALTAPGALRASLASFRAPVPALSAPATVRRLTLLGESDPRFDLLALRAAGAVFETIPRGGHWLAEERPDPVAAALLTFFRENSPP